METHVAAAITLLMTTAIGAVLVATNRLVTNQSLRRGSEDLAVARSAFKRLMEARADAVAAQVRLIAAQPIFRARLTDAPLPADLAILRTMADEYPRQLGAAFCIITNRPGAWLAVPGWSEQNEVPVSLQSTIRAATDGHPESTVVPIGGRLFLIVSEPARFAEETLGVVTVGIALDDSVARELAAITQCEVTLVVGVSLSGTSLQPDSRVGLIRMLEAHEPARGSPVLQRLGPRKYVSGTFPLTSDRADRVAGRLLLLRDWGPTQQLLDELTRQFLNAGIIVLACALVGGLVFSRWMSRPFQDIARAARDIAADRTWTRQVPLRGTAEAMTMATAFNEMSTSLQHWYEEAQTKSERLQASYARFYEVTESARDAIVSTDHRGAITFWNRSAEILFGREEAEAIGMPLTHVIAPPDRPRYIDVFTALGNDAETVVIPIIEIAGVRRDGSTFPIELSLSTRQTDGGAHVTAVIRDITERKRAQEALQQRDEQLRQAQKMEAIGRLAGGVAHDFNNLLTAITGFGVLAKEGLGPDDSHRSDIDEILGAADRAAALTRQLLAFSRREVVRPQLLALDQIVANTEKMLRRLIGEHITLSSTATPEIGCVRADPGQIEQVLINLCVNGRDAMPQGGELHIALSNVELDQAGLGADDGPEPGPYVRLTVSDTGCGIDPDMMSRIFEPFFTTKQEGKGTGLGLATVYGIVKQSGGHLAVESQVGRGTTFTIDFPRVESSHEVADVPSIQSAPQQASETVLLVEDDDRVRGLVASVLRRRGYEVLEASRGDEALELVRGHTAPIHLLLSDVVMPGMSGRIVATRVVELRPETRVLLMSGYSDDIALRGEDEAANMPLIQKPFSMDALEARIREALRGAA